MGTREVFMMRSIVRALAAFAALALVCGVLATDADARAGGGSSMGSRGGRTFSAPAPTRTAPSPGSPIQRSVTQPPQQTPGFAPSSPGFFGRPGLLGGLAA